MPMWKPWCCEFSILYLSILVVIVSASSQGNPADEIVNFINKNRTASKLPKLYDSPGLGCMALQYISECMGNCTTNDTLGCQPPEVDITEVYAPNCGVELPTVDIISGRFIGCHWTYLDPEHALSTVLIIDKKAISLLHSKELTEVGVGLNRAHGGAFFWCVLFSSGRTNSTFVLEGGRGIEQKSGCFSGTTLQCNAAKKLLLLKGFTPVALTVTISFVISIILPP